MASFCLMRMKIVKSKNNDPTRENWRAVPIEFGWDSSGWDVVYFQMFISYLSLVLGGPRYHNITLARGRQLIADQFSSNHTTHNLLLSIGQSRSKRFRKEQNYLRSSNVTRPEGLKLQTRDLIGHPGRRRGEGRWDGSRVEQDNGKTMEWLN